MSNEKVQVAVRVRPFNRRELDLRTPSIIDIQASSIIIRSSSDDADKKSTKSFSFDHCFDSKEEHGVGQGEVFEALGLGILDNAFKGYNASVFAYGQTGSGKSYTMMGTQEDSGLIPRLCSELFSRIDHQKDSSEVTAEVSYMEIYNEKVYDLLDPASVSGKRVGLKVREHSVLGPYVDGLSKLVVSSYEDIDALMEEGNKSRTVAATNMNNESSRSHAVFTIILTFRLRDELSGVEGTKVSRICLVDLAGSERAVKTGAVGQRLKEGSNINKSLTTLGLVISKLADQQLAISKNKDKFVPYRDSVLTWLLKDSLGGNSRTIMIATLSPSADNHHESLSTLRYADRAKRIVNHAVVNEDPNAKIIRELRSEIETLKELLIHTADPQMLKEKLGENEKLMKEVSLTWQQKKDKTEQIQEDRRQAIEKMGISLQSSGIKVEKDRYFLVNLNADPSLNELLVYYIQDTTLVGREEANVLQNIQLSGLGIQAEHCKLSVEDDSLYIEPFPGAKTCVNGKEIQTRTLAEDGDRILWGFNHFFRVNCPNKNKDKDTNLLDVEGRDTMPSIDWRMAQEEVMLMENLSERELRMKMEKRFNTEKQTALENQRLEYERKLENLRHTITLQQDFEYPTRHSLLTSSFLEEEDGWGNSCDEKWRQGVSKLKEEIIQANLLIREANLLAEELGKSARFSATLRIPPQNLTLNRPPGGFLAEPAILVRQGEAGPATWSLDKMDAKIVRMRELYKMAGPRSSVEPFNQDDTNEQSGDLNTTLEELLDDPFSEPTQNHELIGVANLFLGSLFHGVKFQYWVPVISPQGEVAGKLEIELEKTGGSLPEDRMAGGDEDSESSEVLSQASRESKHSKVSSESRPSDESKISFILRIRELKGVDLAFSEFVFCEFCLDSQEPILVLPKMDSLKLSQFEQNVSFNFEKEFVLTVNEDLIDFCTDGAIPIHVLGQRSDLLEDFHVAGSPGKKVKSLEDVWDMVSRRLELTMAVLELNDEGEYVPVEVVREEGGTAGIFQLRHGQQKRMSFNIQPIEGSGSLPLELDGILNVSIGCPCVRSKTDKPMDSYQEDDLNQLRERWSQALDIRKNHLQTQIQAFLDIPEKNEQEKAREESLLGQLVELMEEQNATYSPPDNSKIPGSMVNTFLKGDGIERHQPVIFLDTESGEKFHDTSIEDELGIPLYGQDSVLPNELGTMFVSHPIVSYSESETGCLVSWDSSLHDSHALNRVTDTNQRVFMIARVTVRLTQPCIMDIVLRKRFSFIIYKKQSLTDRIWKKLGPVNPQTSQGVVYHLVYNIPRTSSELENRASLAAAAASGQEIFADDGESLVEKYSKGVSAVDELLRTDKVRQHIALKELLTKKMIVKMPLNSMRKTFSVPNMRILKNSISLENISAMNFRPSDSFHELNLELGKTRKVNVEDEPRGILRRMTNSKTMTTLHEGKSTLSPNSQLLKSPRQTLENQRWCERKGILPPADTNLSVSSGYQSKAVSLSSEDEEEKES